MLNRVVLARIVALILAMLLAGAVPAQDCIEYGDFFHLAGGVSVPQFRLYDVAISGSHAYVTGSKLTVVDITDPAFMEVVGDVDEQCVRVATSSDYAFVLSSDCLLILDITDPHDPQLVGTVDMDSDDVAVVNDHVCVVSGGSTSVLQVFDASDPTTPYLMGSVELLGCGRPSVASSGNHAFVAGNGLDIVDIADPGNPVVVAHIDLPGELHAISVDDDIACTLGNGTLYMIDVADPVNPWVIGNVAGQFYYGRGLAVDGNHAYVADGWQGLCVFDITETEPSLVVVHAGLDGYARDVAISNEVAFVTLCPDHSMVGYRGLLAVTSPTMGLAPDVGGVDTPGDAMDVAVSGAYSYVADGGGGLQVVDASDPQEPQIVAYHETPGEAVGVAVSEDHAFVVDLDAGLLIIDITNPTSPWITGQVETPGTAHDIALSGDHAYVADEYAGLQVIDITDLTGPQIVAAVATPGPVRDVAILGDYAYIAGQDFHVVDITAPTNPWITGSLESAEEYSLYRAVGVFGDKVYLSQWFLFESTLFTVVDVSEPSDPCVMGSTVSMSMVEKLVVEDGYAYVTACVARDTDLGFHVANVSDPDSPRFIGSNLGYGAARGLAVTDEHIHVAARWSGLKIVPLQCGNTVRIDGETEDPDSELPQVGLRLAAHPNPFNPQTTITFSLEQAGRSIVEVYELTGKRVATLADRAFTAGEHSLLWNGRDAAGRSMPSGTYLVRLETESAVRAQKLMLVR